MHYGMGISQIATEFMCEFVQRKHALFPHTLLLFPEVEQPQQDVRPYDCGIGQQMADTVEAPLYANADIF